MYRGGVTINERTAQIIRIAGLIVPSVLVIYGVLVQHGIVSTTHYVNDTVFYTIMVPWIIGAIWQFLYPSHNAVVSGIRLIGYHLLAGLFILFVAGFTTSFITAWILL